MQSAADYVATAQLCGFIMGFQMPDLAVALAVEAALVVAHSRKQNHATVAVMVTPPIIALVLKVLT